MLGDEFSTQWYSMSVHSEKHPAYWECGMAWCLQLSSFFRLSNKRDPLSWEGVSIVDALAGDAGAVGRGASVDVGGSPLGRAENVLKIDPSSR